MIKLLGAEKTFPSRSELQSPFRIFKFIETGERKGKMSLETTETWDKAPTGDYDERIRYLHSMSNKQPHTKDGKLDLYKDIAEDYDKLAQHNNWKSPETTALRLVPYMINRLSPTPEEAYRILDAGCGTGLCTQSLRKAWTETYATKLHVTAVDFSEDMLAVAKSKECYDELHQVDLSKRDGSLEKLAPFDFILSSGVFYDGHCGPQELTRLLETLKPDGVASITVRKESYLPIEKEYLQAVEQAGCDVAANDSLFYQLIEGEEREANYLLLRKRT